MTALGPKTQIPPETDVEALIKEARRLRRRRWLTGCTAFICAAAAVALGLTAGGGGTAPRGTPGSNGRVPATRGASVAPVEPTALAVINGDLYMDDAGRQEILKRSPDGRFSVVAHTHDSWNLVASGGSLYFEQARVVRQLSPGGHVRTVAGLHPSCAGVHALSTSIAAQSAKLGADSLSAGPDGQVWIVGSSQCPQAQRLGPVLRLTPTGYLVDVKLDARVDSLPVGRYMSFCGPSASAPGFTAFLCESGRGHPKELLVLRANGTTADYPSFGEGEIAAGDGEVFAVRDDSVVRVTSHGLRPVASLKALKPAPGGYGGTVVSLALSKAGTLFMITDRYDHRRGCTATISEVPARGRTRTLWERRSNLCY